MLARRNLSTASEMSIEYFKVLDAIYIHQTPSWNGAAAASAHLQTKQANKSILNAVVMRFNDPLVAFVPEPEQLLVCNGTPKH